eukprot:Skav206629  [mRNA]  locus=scaffold2321:104563:104979:+ [translate_table: standard]
MKVDAISLKKHGHQIPHGDIPRRGIGVCGLRHPKGQLTGTPTAIVVHPNVLNSHTAHRPAMACFQMGVGAFVVHAARSFENAAAAQSSIVPGTHRVLSLVGNVFHHSVGVHQKARAQPFHLFIGEVRTLIPTIAHIVV